MADSTPTIAIFGASGRTGRALVAAALEKGWHVRALLRAGALAPPESQAIQAIAGGFDDTDAIVAAVRSAHAVCCLFGPRPPHTEVFCAQATKRVVEAMQQQGVRRLICQTGAMIGEHYPNRTFWCERMARAFSSRQPEAAEDRRFQETIVQASGLDWTILKPPRLTNGRPRGKLRAGSDLRVGLLSKISRADLAVCILEEIERPRFLRQTVFVSG